MPPKKRDRCVKEVHLLQQLSHPNIITMYDAFVDHEQLVIITEWAPGGDLKWLVRRMAEAGRSFGEPEIWLYFSQILDGLRGMHASRILHRDIKPANVLVCAAGVLKLGDLGLGRKMGPQTVDVASKVGTPYYCSPEVVKGVKYDFKSDMWSMGCLLYELAMLKSPFEMEGANLYDVFQKIGRGDFQPLPADRFSPAMRAAVLQLLAQDPNTRPSAEQCHQQVLLVQQQLEQLQALPGQLQQQAGPPQRQLQQTVSAKRTQQLLRTLQVIASSTSSSGNGSSRLSRSPSRKGHSSSAVEGAAAAVLKQLHPLLFAQPLAAFGSKGGAALPGVLTEERAQQQQMGLAVAVARKAAQNIGLQGLEAAPAAQLALGHGTAVCWLLQGMADIVWAQLQLACRPYSHNPASEEVHHEELQQDDAEGEADIGAAAAAMAAAAGEGSEDLGGLGSAPAFIEQQVARQRGSPEGSHAGPPAAGHIAAIQTQVDPSAWKAEARRLAPQLAQLRLPAGDTPPPPAAAACLEQEWLSRWHATRQLQQQLGTLVQQLQGAPALPGVQRRLAEELQRLLQVEQRVNQEMAEPLERYSQAHLQLEVLLQQRHSRDGAVQAAQQQLHEISCRTEDVQQRLAQRTDQLQGSVLLQRQRSFD
ncbi:NimA-related protein kinase 6 [Scenedesmus sp. NREL 46B-D3]|nr:NimA-related protein kinase 6 [Scenedesmus sp. NREL 46B-D3]